MFILAAVSINFLLGENGILKKAKGASNNYSESAVQEELQLAATSCYTDKAINDNLTNEDIANLMSEEYPDIEWVYKEKLAGIYKGYDFTVSDGKILMNVFKDCSIPMNQSKAVTTINTEDYFWQYRFNIVNLHVLKDKDIAKYENQANAVQNDKGEYKPWNMGDNKYCQIYVYLVDDNYTVKNYYNNSDIEAYDLYMVSNSRINLPSDSSGFFKEFVNVANV